MTGRCENCANWKRVNILSIQGECSADHRFWHVPMPDGSFAMADSFGPTEMRAVETCGAWKARKALVDPYALGGGK